MRAPASRARPSAIFSSTRPAPTAMVSAACASALSPSATAAAMPPCAHAVEAPWPKGAAEITVTGRGASFNAQNSPARPPPTMTTSLVVRSLSRLGMSASPLPSSPRKRGPIRRAVSVSVGGNFRGLISSGGYGSPRSRGRHCLSDLVLQIDHPLHRAPRLRGDQGIDGDFLAQVNQAVENLGQRDPLHVRAQIAGPHHLDIRQLGPDVVGH